MTGIVEDSTFLHLAISLGVLLFTAKVFAEIFHHFKLPVVLGELLAGIVVGPFALGGLIEFDGKPLVNLDGTLHSIGELSVTVYSRSRDNTKRILEGRCFSLHCGVDRCYHTIFCGLCCL